VTAAVPGSAGGRLQRIGVVAGCVLLTALFTFLLFPWERLAPWVSRQIAAGSGAQVSVHGTRAGIGWLGPRLRVDGVSLRWADGRALQLDSGSVRPALSFSWLRGAPALAVDARGPGIEGHGTLWPDRPAFDGAIETGDAAALLTSWIPPGGPSLSGPLRARLDLTTPRAAGPPTGTIQLSGKDGSLALPGLPMALPYQSLAGTLRLELGRPLRIDGLKLTGPLLSLEASGTVRLGPDPAASPRRWRPSASAWRPMGPAGSAWEEPWGHPRCADVVLRGPIIGSIYPD
jgi:type II secretion system protein N